VTSEHKGIYTARGTQLPPSPNVTPEVEEWGNLIKFIRDLKYTPQHVKTILNEDQRKKAEVQAMGQANGDL